MATLGETAVVARKAIKYGGIGLVVLMIGRIVVTNAYTYWRKLNPPPPPPPDIKWGKLPKLVFPLKEQPSLSYRLETKTGGLPNKMPTQFTVYFMPIKKASLLAYDEAKGVANRLEFIQEPKKLDETHYRWDLTEPVLSSLTIDVITGAFVLDREWRDDPSYATPTQYLNETQAVERVYNLLARVDLLPDDIKEGTHTIQNLRGEGGEIVPAVSLSQAHFVRVNLYRASIEETPIVNASKDLGLISAIIALQRDEEKQFVQIDYNYFPVSLETKSVYPLITVSEAWQKMQTGGGFVAGVAEGKTEIVVRNVYLAYYDTELPQQYLQPVYVFEGDPEFLGIVPAVSDEWVE